MASVRDILNGYIKRNTFNNGVNDGDCKIICNGKKSFIAHSTQLSAVSQYMKHIIEHKISTDNKIEITMDFPCNVVKKFIEWTYQHNSPFENYFKEFAFDHKFIVFKLFDKLGLDSSFDNAVNNYYLYVQTAIKNANCTKTDWALLLSFLENYDNKYYALLKNDIMRTAHKEIKNYVVSYLLDIVHSEYLQDDKHTLDGLSTFANESNYSLSRETKHEIIIMGLIEHNMNNNTNTKKQQNKKSN